MTVLMKLRATVRDQAFVTLNKQAYEVLSSFPSQVPPHAYNLSPWIGREVVIEGYLNGRQLHAMQVTPLVDYQPIAPVNQHRLGTTLHPLNGIRSLNWQSEWSVTHAIEPSPAENPPWNDPINRSPQNLLRVIHFLNVTSTPRYQPRVGWLGNTVFVSDVTRMLHCEICLDPIGERKWFNYSATNMIQYIRLVSTIEHGWRWVETPAEAQELANQGLPVVALRAAHPPHLAIVVAGKLNEVGFPLVAQAGRRNFNAGYWEDPLVEYITHA